MQPLTVRGGTVLHWRSRRLKIEFEQIATKITNECIEAKPRHQHGFSPKPVFLIDSVKKRGAADTNGRAGDAFSRALRRRRAKRGLVRLRSRVAVVVAENCTELPVGSGLFAGFFGVVGLPPGGTRRLLHPGSLRSFDPGSRPAIKGGRRQGTSVDSPPHPPLGNPHATIPRT